MKPLSHHLKLTMLLLTVTTLILSGPVLATYDDTLTESFTVAPGGTLNVKIDLGRIEVRGTSGNKVDIKVYRTVKVLDGRGAEKYLDDFKIKFKQAGKDIYITGEHESRGLIRLWSKIANKLRIKFVVTVPEVFNVDLKTSGGGIAVIDLEGEVLADTSGGGLDFDNIKGNITAETSGGGIDVGSVVGEIDIHTSGGGIRVHEVKGTINAHTSGGSLKVHISEQPESDCRLTTSGGSITVYLNEGIGVNLDASTSGGSVNIDFPIRVTGKINKRHIKSDLNGGGPLLYVHTSGGSVYIKKK